MKIKHSKYKNTGVIFELLIRQITKDSLEDKESPVKQLLPKYFVNTELGKEYKLYESLTSKGLLSESKAEMIINTLLEASKTLNRSIIKRQKYNLIKEIKEHYNINSFFSHNISNYKLYASFYTLLEIANNSKISNIEQTIQNKVTVLEHLTASKVDKSQVQKTIFEEYKEEDKDVRILAYKILLERFNDKYGDLNFDQKEILKKLITSSNNPKDLKDFYTEQIVKLKETLISLNTNTFDPTIKIKLNEVVNLLELPSKNYKVTDNDLVNLMHYYELIQELEVVNG